jgi:hypothetical protein
MSKVHQVPVSAVLALLKAGETSYFLCYNVAVMLVPTFERHFYVKWMRYKDNDFDNQDVKSGYYAFAFIKFNLKVAEFEESMFKDNLTNWVKTYFETSDVDTMTRLNYLADDLNMDRRKFRIRLLEKVLADNPDATFKVVF